MRKPIAIAALTLVASLTATLALADTSVITDRKKETKALKRNAELDIVRAVASHATGGRLKHKVTMRGRVKKGRPNTRPLLLINTRGGPRSAYEYVVVGRDVLRVRGDEAKRTGTSQLAARKRTWTYRFSPEAIGNPRSYGWAAVTSRGKARDVAPGRRFAEHELRR